MFAMLCVYALTSTVPYRSERLSHLAQKALADLQKERAST